MRRKITLLIPVKILMAFDELAKRQLGVGRNSFFAIAALMLLAKMCPILPGKKRSTLLNDIQNEFDLLMTELRKTA